MAVISIVARGCGKIHGTVINSGPIGTTVKNFQSHMIFQPDRERKTRFSTFNPITHYKPYC